MSRTTPSDGSALRIAVIGAGWAGCAAAVELSRHGRMVDVYEAARHPGGRARALHRERDDWEGGLDNGQHILLGAYRESLRLMRVVGVDPERALLRLPLQMPYPEGTGGMDFHCPRLPAPFHLLTGLLRTNGLSWADKMALVRFSTAARWIDWRLTGDRSVTDLLAQFDQTERAIALLWRPLCLAALNTPPERASAQVFLNVLRDSLGARRAASDMLLPRIDLGSLFPNPALTFVARHGGHVHLGCRVRRIEAIAGGFMLSTGSQAEAPDGHGDQAGAGIRYECVIVALPAAEATRIMTGLGRQADTSWRASDSERALERQAQTDMQAQAEEQPTKPVQSVKPVQPAEPVQPAKPAKPAQPVQPVRTTSPAFSPQHEAITTCYLRYAPGTRLTRPFFALRDDAATGRPGQFVFDRGQLNAGEDGILAVVISASSEIGSMPAQDLARLAAAQLADAFSDARLNTPSDIRVVNEKHATFSCTPRLVRPHAITDVAGVFLAGDHVAGDYPSTIEGAVRSGVAAARLALEIRVRG